MLLAQVVRVAQVAHRRAVHAHELAPRPCGGHWVHLRDGLVVDEARLDGALLEDGHEARAPHKALQGVDAPGHADHVDVEARALALSDRAAIVGDELELVGAGGEGAELHHLLARRAGGHGFVDVVLRLVPHPGGVVGHNLELRVLQGHGGQVPPLLLDHQQELVGHVHGGEVLAAQVHVVDDHGIPPRGRELEGHAVGARGDLLGARRRLSDQVVGRVHVRHDVPVPGDDGDVEGHGAVLVPHVLPQHQVAQPVPEGECEVPAGVQRARGLAGGGGLPELRRVLQHLDGEAHQDDLPPAHRLPEDCVVAGLVQPRVRLERGPEGLRGGRHALHVLEGLVAHVPELRVLVAGEEGAHAVRATARGPRVGEARLHPGGHVRRPPEGRYHNVRARRCGRLRLDRHGPALVVVGPRLPGPLGALLIPLGEQVLRARGQGDR
mmetsp:Transcript_50552/g.161710  ORF Transcript_50552/g.161710 Transcript_50552/m.161710 type:complete len:438 (+) Transcript_50552:1351-2664(+)